MIQTLRLTLLACLLSAATTSAAQEIWDCGADPALAPIAQAGNIVEPWAENSRTYARDDVRVALLNTTEPAAHAAYLMILSLPLDELGIRQCVIVGEGQGTGFLAIDFQAIRAHYDANHGLTLTLPAQSTNPADPAKPIVRKLQVVINQKTGAHEARFAE